MMCAPSSRPGLITTSSPVAKPSVPSPSASTTPAPSAPRIRGLGAEGRPWRVQMSRWLREAARRRIRTSPGAGDRIVRVLVAEDLRTAVLVDAHRFHGRILTAARWYLPLDAAGGAQSPGRGARARRRGGGTRRGLRGDRAAHPRAPRPRPFRADAVHDGAAGGELPPRVALARSALGRLRGALLLRAPGPMPSLERGAFPGTRGATATPSSATKLERLGRAARRRLPRARGRESARRPGGRGARRGGVLRKEHAAHHARHGSWVVLGTVVTTAEIERSAAARPRLRLVHAAASTPARQGRSTSPASSTRPSACRTGARHPAPCPSTAGRWGVRLRMRHLPGRLPLEPRHGEAPRRRGPAGGRGAHRLVARVARGGRRRPDRRGDRLYFPRNDPRWLRRNALTALGNTATQDGLDLAEQWTGSEDPVLADVAG